MDEICIGVDDRNGTLSHCTRPATRMVVTRYSVDDDLHIARVHLCDYHSVPEYMGGFIRKMDDCPTCGEEPDGWGFFHCTHHKSLGNYRAAKSFKYIPPEQETVEDWGDFCDCGCDDGK